MMTDPTHFDPYLAYCDIIIRTYGATYCPTREQWDAACHQPPSPRRSDHEIDHEAELRGDAQ